MSGTVNTLSLEKTPGRDEASSLSHPPTKTQPMGTLMSRSRSPLGGKMKNASSR